MTFRALGEGEGTISYRCVYRTVIDEEACHFELNVLLVEDDNRDIARANPDAKIQLKMTVCISFFSSLVLIYWSTDKLWARRFTMGHCIRYIFLIKFAGTGHNWGLVSSHCWHLGSGRSNVTNFYVGASRSSKIQVSSFILDMQKWLKTTKLKRNILKSWPLE